MIVSKINYEMSLMNFKYKKNLKIIKSNDKSLIKTIFKRYTCLKKNTLTLVKNCINR